MNDKNEILNYFSESEGILDSIKALFKELDENNLTKKSSIEIIEKHGSLEILSEISEKDNFPKFNEMIKKYQSILNIQCFKCGKLNGRHDYICEECIENYQEENAYKDISLVGFSFTEIDYFNLDRNVRKFIKWNEFEKLELIKDDSLGKIIERIEFKLCKPMSIEMPNDKPLIENFFHCSYLTRNFYLLLKNIPKTLLSNNDINDIEKTLKNLENQLYKRYSEI
uniref:hypothetical protein n=1 Tax=Flavobacterium sp. TaxID=239 RepID=UPI004049D0AF